MIRVGIGALTALLLGSLSASAEPRATSAPTATESQKVGSNGVVNLNDANAEELERLPGVGPAKAQAIMEHRKLHPFRRLEEITKVKGIGRKTFARLRPYISLMGPTTLKTAAAARR